MAQLKDFRDQPGTRLRTEFASPIMVLQLCAGMIRQGDATGGKETIAVVDLATGRTSFEHETLEVVPARED